MLVLTEKCLPRTLYNFRPLRGLAFVGGKFGDAELTTLPLNLLSAPAVRKYFFWGWGEKLLRELWGPRATRDDLELVLIPHVAAP